ncbi:MAG TPA: CDP-alcohol phosphatidyltransferase family protein [Candidatus Limnocylindrales bacterium]|nr:CDP-alcohol phosphatidyltransferase family protein [Candidatus Limnocylindrales bacterium]
MSASQPRARDLRHGDSLLSTRIKETGRAVLQPVVRLAVRLHLTANTVTVIGFFIVAGAAVLVASGNLLAGAALLTAGSLLDAVDGALARATGGTTPFGGFLDSTLDRAAEAFLYAGVAGYYLLGSQEPAWPVLLALAALTGSFLVSYTRARAEGMGLTAEIGVAPRVERLVLVIAGIALAGIGIEVGLIGAMAVVAVLAVATTAQRIWHVHRLSAALPRNAPDDTTRENVIRG